MLVKGISRPLWGQNLGAQLHSAYVCSKSSSSFSSMRSKIVTSQRDSKYSCASNGMREKGLLATLLSNCATLGEERWLRCSRWSCSKSKISLRIGIKWIRSGPECLDAAECEDDVEHNMECMDSTECVDSMERGEQECALGWAPWGDFFFQNADSSAVVTDVENKIAPKQTDIDPH